MKKLLTLSITLIIANFIFVSCNSKLSVIKRHHGKGYYVNSGSSKNNKKIEINQEEDTKLKSRKTNTIAYNPIEKISTESDSIKSVSVKSENISNKKKISPVKVLTKLRKARNNAYSNNVFQASKPKESFENISKEKFENSTSDGERHGLSLFWIVILILLLLWAFGFAYVASSLIHILLVLALILLILWLLRVI